MDELRRALGPLIDDNRLPGRPPVEALRERNHRRRRRTRRTRALIAAIAAAGVAAGLAVAATGVAPRPAGLVARELAAFRAGKTVFRLKGGPPVTMFGLIGTGKLWVLDGSGLFLSTDAGRDFRAVTPPVGGSPIGQILAADFPSASRGWVLAVRRTGAGLVIFRTEKGGTTWSASQLPPVAPNGVGTASMSFAGRDGWIAVQAYTTSGLRNVLLATVDAGVTWRVASDRIPVATIEFTGPRSGWGLGQEGGLTRLYVTRNAGRTWRLVSLPAPGGASGAVVPFGIPVFRGRTGVFLAGRPSGQAGHPPGPAWAELSWDGGLTWHPRTAPFALSGCAAAVRCQLAFAAASATDWYYWPGNVLWLTRDAGIRWSRVIPNVAFARRLGEAVAVFPGPGRARASKPLVFSSPSSGWAVASAPSGSVLLHTGDGGASFTTLRSPAASAQDSIPGEPGIARPGTIVRSYRVARRARRRQ